CQSGPQPAAGASSGKEGNRYQAAPDVRRAPKFAPRLTGRSSASAASSLILHITAHSGGSIMQLSVDLGKKDKQLEKQCDVQSGTVAAAKRHLWQSRRLLAAVFGERSCIGMGRSSPALALTSAKVSRILGVGGRTGRRRAKEGVYGTAV